MTTREYAKNLFSQWSDDDFCNQPIFDKLLFQVLNGQRAVNAAGIQPINFTRWRKAMRDGDRNPPVTAVKEALIRMERRGYVYTDEDAGEVLIRSRIRRDELNKQPTVFLSALRLLAVIDSPKFAAVMDRELDRMVCPDVKGDKDFAKKLRQALNEASTNARTHLKTLSEGYSEPYPEPFAEDFPEGYSGGYSPPGEIGPSDRPNTEGSPIPSGSGSVSVSNSLPAVGSVGRGNTSSAENGQRQTNPGRNEPPPRFCSKHMPDGTDDKCGACAGYRKHRERWDEQHAGDAPNALADFWTDVRQSKCCDERGLTDGPGNSVARCPNHDWSLVNA